MKLVHEVPVQALPAGFNPIITAIDNFLSSPAWAVDEEYRERTVLASEVSGGFNQSNMQNLQKLLADYRLRGRWNVSTVIGTPTQMTIRFSRRPD
jgi:hypothetical protein